MSWDSGIIEEVVVEVLAETGVRKVSNGETPSENEVIAILTVAVHAIARYCVKNRIDIEPFTSSFLEVLKREFNRYKREVVE